MTPWTADCQLTMEFFRQQYPSGLQFPTPGDLPDSGIEPAFLESPALAGRFFTTEPPGKMHTNRDKWNRNKQNHVNKGIHTIL